MEAVMQQFLCIHTVPANTIGRTELERFAEAAQHDADVRGYRSFMSPSKGKLVCILEAPDEAVVASFFHHMGLPVDSITRLEFEGDRGTVRDAGMMHAGV
jgi:hypothetical protein